MESTSGRLAPGGQRPRAFRHDSSLWQVHRRAGSIRQHSRMVSIKAQGYDTQEPDWEEEMSIFKRRTLKPSQLEALRKLEAEKVDVGRVLFSQDSIAIVEGLNNDAGVGTALSFASGAIGVLLWRRSDNLVFALLLGGADLVTVGDGVECRVKSILQVVDETEGPSTKRDYALTTVPVGEALIGQVVDFLGRPVSDDGTTLLDPSPLGASEQVPILNVQPDMESREQIAEPLLTGVKALDILTPLGRGQALQVSGPQFSGKTQLCIDAIVGQAGSGVRCVYAAVGAAPEQLARTVEQLRSQGCMAYTTVVAASSARPLGEQYAAMLTTCSMAEATRDSGGHALVVLNNVAVMVRMWERIAVAMADLGPMELERDENALALLAEQTDPDVAIAAEPEAAAEATAAAGEAGSSGDSEEGGEEEGGEDENLVEYEGMLVSAAAAQRRRFFSSLIQRSAKIHRRLRGGSMTMLLVVPGVPASGKARAAREKVLQYRHLSEGQKAKLLTALEAQGGSGVRDPGPDELRTEVVEEFMSICDGQAVLRSPPDVPTGGVVLDPQLSVSRIGSRAFYPAMADLATQVRFDLAQAEDAARFAAGAGGDSAAAQKAVSRAAAVTAALPQPRRQTCSLAEQIVQLLALQQGLLDGVPAGQVAARLAELTGHVLAECPEAVEEITATKRLTAAAKAAMSKALEAACAAAR